MLDMVFNEINPYRDNKLVSHLTSDSINMTSGHDDPDHLQTLVGPMELGRKPKLVMIND